jgi:membrane protein insertase Oxa1/YidC/SpoIIIJ
MSCISQVKLANKNRQFITRSNNAFLVPTIRDFSLRPGLRQSVSRFSTFNTRGSSLFSKVPVIFVLLIQNVHPIFPASRPTVNVPRARLAACISTEAQRILDETPGAELRKFLGPSTEMDDLAALDLGTTWWPSDLMISLLEFCHVSSGLPWWGSIVLLTAMLRVALFPLSLKIARNTAISPHILGAHSGLLEETRVARQSNDLVKMKMATMKLKDLYRSWGYSPLVPLFGIVQVPFFFAMFRSCWRCSKAPVPGWETGGGLWFTDLTASDPYFILPVVSGVTTAFTILVVLSQGSSYRSLDRRMLLHHPPGCWALLEHCLRS